MMANARFSQKLPFRASPAIWPQLQRCHLLLFTSAADQAQLVKEQTIWSSASGILDGGL